MVVRAGRTVANHIWNTDVRFTSPMPDDNSIVIACMRTFKGSNTAQVRIKALTQNGFHVRVEEEKSKDEEIKHVEEEIDYIAFSPGIIKNWSGETIGEAGTLEIDQPDQHVWCRVSPTIPIEDPVVFAQVMSYGLEVFPIVKEPVHIRISGVGVGSLEHKQPFFFKMEEWKYQNQKHEKEKIGWVILKAGSHTLEGNNRLYVGRTSTDHGWSQGILNTREISSIVTQCQTFNGWHPIVTRMRVTDDYSVEVRIQEEEAEGPHVDEVIGYLEHTPFT